MLPFDLLAYGVRDIDCTHFGFKDTYLKSVKCYLDISNLHRLSTPTKIGRKWWKLFPKKQVMEAKEIVSLFADMSCLSCWIRTTRGVRGLKAHLTKPYYLADSMCNCKSIAPYYQKKYDVAAKRELTLALRALIIDACEARSLGRI